MNDGKRTLRLEIKVAPAVARAMEAMRLEMQRGEHRSANKYEVEDLASEILEQDILTRFELMFGAPAAIVFRQDTCVGERGPRARR